ncbi:AMP-binding protein [Streptomyces sp. NPDC127117]|uniref:AMP-binding protein n=1 Tax=Streptomyces sp. NPDC127117 TaxID=3345368 RepID=UPI0036277E80
MDFEQYPDRHFRCLTRADVIEAARDVDIVATVAQALRLHSAGHSVLPEEAHLGWTTPQGDAARLPAMPGALTEEGRAPVIGMKTINASIGNPARGIPRSQGFTLLLDPALFAATVRQERITHLFLTPQLLDGLLAESAGHSGGHRPVLVTSGADTLPVETVRRFREVWPDATLLNLYGMTETASNVAAYDTARLPADAERVPVGSPVAGASLSVRDRLGRRLPNGVSGEVWVSGPPLALGYVGGDGEDRFTTDGAGIRQYRTGDRGRKLPDSVLEITGRADNQIKVRGYRVELEEIEATLRKAPDVTDAGAYAQSEDRETRIVACVTSDEETSPAALRAYLRDRLPDYMLPARIQQLPRLPLSTNGKLDRTALRTLVADIGQERAAGFIPSDATEAAVSALWQELLGAPPASADQNFFDAGGHSLLAVRLANRLAATAGRRIPLRRILGAPTVTAIAALCREIQQEEQI